MRIHRNKSVIKHMFFTQDDVRYFIRERLQTDKGLEGRILKPTTEKGYFKAHFDGVINSGDCIEMRLYKPIPNTGISMGMTYEVCPGVNMAGFQAFKEIFEYLQYIYEKSLI